MKKLLVIDGNSIINRAFYGIRLLTNRAGVYTNAIYGMVNIVMRQVEKLEPEYCAVAFDVKAPTFRHQFYDAYKAGRHATPPELLAQIPIAKEVMRALGLRVLEMPGYEADDILGTLSEMATAQGYEAYLLTGDRDSLQLISDRATVLLATNSDTVSFDRSAFREKYGVEPEQFVDVKALMGDSSDNIPGVPGIGEKTAVKLIAEFGTLEKLYESLPSETLTKSVNEKLMVGKDSAFLSQRLARIVCNVPIIESLVEATRMPMDRPVAKRLFTELEFSVFLKRFGLEGEEPTANARVEERVPELLDVTVEELKKALDSHETVGLWLLEDAMLFTVGGQCFRLSGGFEEYKKILSLCGHKWICYDAKTLYKRASAEHFDFRGIYHDVMLGAYVLNPADSFDYERLCMRYLGESEGALPISRLPALYESIEAKIRENRQESLLYDIEMPLASVLSDMESVGCSVDIEGLRQYGERLCKLENEYKERIYMLAGLEFNINSPKQLGEVLFERLNLPSGKKTKTGYSTNAEILEKLRPYHPIIGDILDYRQVAKLRSTYAEGLLAAADREQRIHTHFKQTGTATGRLSSNEPNLQNIPIRTELGREFRRFFVASSPSRVLIDADYSQIELRLLADISGDEVMCEAFRNGMDIHTATASRVFGVPPEAVTLELRKRAKAVNFGIVYGIGDFSLAGDLGISRVSAKEYIESYLATYPGVERYLADIVKSAYEVGYVSTAFGRRRYIPELAEKNKMRRAFGERVAMNSPIQGTAADIIKIAMLKVSKRLAESGLDARLILQVHDELLVEADRTVADKVKTLLKEEMENAVALSIPLEVEVGVGDNWQECH